MASLNLMMSKCTWPAQVVFTTLLAPQHNTTQPDNILLLPNCVLQIPFGGINEVLYYLTTS